MICCEYLQSVKLMSSIVGIGKNKFRLAIGESRTGTRLTVAVVGGELRGAYGLNRRPRLGCPDLTQARAHVSGAAIVSADASGVRPNPNCFAIVDRRSE
jgi:hypothetical protein